MKKKIVCICEKCGKTAPIDYEKSTRYWFAYKTDKPCQCGGKFVTKYE